MSKSSDYTKDAYKTPHVKRHSPGGTIGKGLVHQKKSFDKIESEKEEAVIGRTLSALDRYLATEIGSPEARAAMDHLKLVNARAA